MSESRVTGQWGTWVAAAACATAAACSSEPAPRSAGIPAAPAPLTACVVERRPLTLADGTQVYVEHQDVILVGEDVLLAGSPSYHFDPIPGRIAERLSADAFAAAYLGEPPRMVETPITGTPGSVRVVALDERRWAAIILQVDPDSLPAVDEFRALWYGEHDGERWTRVEAMDFPGRRITSRLSTRLVRVGERLVWLAWESVNARTQLHLYERIDGTWTNSFVPDADRVEQVELAYLEGSGLWMLLSGFDPGLPDQKSLRLYRERSAAGTSLNRWEMVSRVVVAEPDISLRRASLVIHSTGVTVSWTSVGRGESRAMARVGIGPADPGTVVTLDDFAVWVRPVAMLDGSLVWVVDHRDAAATVPEIRLLRFSNGQVTRLASIPSPFPGSFAVRAVAPNEVLVVGPEMGSDSTDVPVRSLILRLSTSC